MQPTTGIFGQALKLPAAHTPVMKRVKRLSKAEQYKERQERKYEYMVAPADPDETWFRHHNWAARRAQVRDGLTNMCTGTFAMNRFDECGGECLVEWSETEQRHRLRANYCHCRHCAPCAKAKARTLSKNLKTRLEQQPTAGNRYRFVTLTLRHGRGDELRPQIDKLYRCFRELRKTKVWKESQVGGCSILEVKWTKATGWHPHLHIASEGQFLRQESLAKEWHRITTDSFKADIRALNDAKDTAFYVSKYISKGVNDEVWTDNNAACEWIAASKGLRICATYGTWRGFALLKIDDANEAKDWQPVGLLAQIAKRARQGVMADILLLLALEEALQYNPHRKREPKKCDTPAG